MPCIPSNPDIVGIGLRIALYTQNLLSFLPAVITLQDLKVTPVELESLEVQSSTILITAFAVLASTIVQSCTGGLTNYHAAIVLNLSWLNNTNSFVYMLLYLYHREATLKSKNGPRWWKNRNLWINEAKLALRNPAIMIGSAHLSLMSVVGIKLWSRPSNFGNSPRCTLSSILVVLGANIPLGSMKLRVSSIILYSTTLFPALNLLPPILFLLIPRVVCHWTHGKSDVRARTLMATGFGLLQLFVIAIIFIVDTELSLQRNHTIIETGDATWTFGQSLALLLLLVPLRDLVELLVKRRPKRLGRKLLDAVREDKVDVVEYVTELGAEGKLRDTALHSAAKKGNLDIVKVLVKMGANVNAKDQRGDSVLHHASKEGHSDVVEFLLNSGARVDKGHRGGSPLHYAAVNGHAKTIRLLYEGGAKLDVNGSYGTPLHFAAYVGHASTIRVLVKLGADMNVPIEEKSGSNGFNHHRSWHETPLHHAVINGRKHAVKAFAKAGADINQGDWNGETLLHDVTRRGDLNGIKALAEAGANISVREERHGQTPLHFAVKNGSEQLVKLLIELGADINERSDSDDKYTDMRNCSPLHIAIRYGRVDLIGTLLDLGADIEAKDSRGWTSLDWAAEDGRAEIIKRLVECSATIHPPETRSGKSPN